jgi:hypothetical protein
MPYIGMLKENNIRQGFFEQEEFDAVLTHLPKDVQPPLRFAYITGWRLKSEVAKAHRRAGGYARGLRPAGGRHQ